MLLCAASQKAESIKCFKLSLPSSGEEGSSLASKLVRALEDPLGEPNNPERIHEKITAMSGMGGEETGVVPSEMELEPTPGKTSQSHPTPARR